MKAAHHVFAALVTVVLTAFAPRLVHADVCVWRDPEQTMAKLFPEAIDYRTVTRKIKAATARKIEKLAGVPLDASERAEFNYYEITGRVGGKTQQVGTVLALAGAGEYGAIEVVIGLDPEARIVGVYIQRMREKKSKKLRANDFLGQFTGKTVADPVTLGDDIQPVKDANAASGTITVAVKKMLAFFEVLK